MLQKDSESTGKVIGFRAIGELTKEDYATLTQEVQALVDREGSIGLLIDLEEFKSEPPKVWSDDLKFGHTYHKKIAKMAIVGDKRWQHLIADLADPFYARESRFFHTADRQAAWEWLRSA
jgi:hypothetical protein